MRLLHVVPSIALETGGPAKSVPALCGRLAEAGHSVRLFTTDWRGTRKISERNFEVQSFRAVPPPIGRLPFSPTLLLALRRASHEVDLVHIHSLWNPVATLSASLLRAFGVPYAISPRGMLDPVVFTRHRWKKGPWAALMERQNVESAALLHFTASAEEEKARQSGWAMRRTVVAPNVIDIGYWKDLPSSKDFEDAFPALTRRKVILFAGRVNWLKNLDVLISSLPQVSAVEPDALLVIAGPDTEQYTPKLQQLAERLGIASRVVFTGILGDRLLKAAYARADCFALVSKRENFGMSAAEALAAGLPVVLSHGVDMGKDWGERPSVFRVSPYPEQVAEALLAALRRATEAGRPDPASRALAAEEWGSSPAAILTAAYTMACADRRIHTNSGRANKTPDSEEAQ